MPGRSRHTTRRAAHRRKPRRRTKRKGGNLKFYIYFHQPDGTHIPVDGQYLTKQQTQNTPQVDFFHGESTGYVVVMYDNDAPSPARIHWLYVVFNNNVNDFFNYQPPNPPAGEVHTYTIDLLTKPGRDMWGIVPEPPPSRTHFDIDDFKRVNGLALEARKTFTCGRSQSQQSQQSQIATRQQSL